MADDTENDIIVEAWNTVLFDKFVRHRAALRKGLGLHSEAFFASGTYPEGASVLDVGCGFGDTTVAIAEQVGERGKCVGVDCAPNFVAEAERFAAEQGASNASFLAADVQMDDLGGPYDYVFARFGTMFFNLPGVAMRNLGRALAPGGELAMIVWRKREDNPWLHMAELKVRELLPVISHEDTDQVHCGPGPFSMAGPDMVSDMLGSAGFERIAFERCDRDYYVGPDIESAVALAVDLGPAGEIIRLAGEEGEARRGEVEQVLRDMLVPFRREDGSVWAGSSSWIVRAHRKA